MQPVKINKWDSSAVKHALDDAVKNALLSQPACRENFSLIDGRLVICGLAVAIALFALAWDHKHPFPESRPILIVCVASYFFLMGVLTLYTTFREKGIFVVAVQDDGTSKKTWQASSDMKKYDDKYTLILQVTDSKRIREATTTKSCALYINNDGVVLENSIANEFTRLYSSLKSDKKSK